MKQSLLLSAAALASVFGMNAETVVWDFNTHGIFAEFQDPESMLARSGNYDFIDKYGDTANTDGERMTYNTFAEDGTTKIWHGINNRVISLWDGATYLMHEADADDAVAAEKGYEVFPGSDIEVTKHPFIGWEQDSEEANKVGPARTIWMIGWGTLDAYADAAYNAVDEANWVATKHALAFLRQGNNGSRKQTYVQFPEVNLPCKVTAYLGTPGGSYAKELNATYQLVQGGVEGAKAQICQDTEFTVKRYYKKEFTIEGTGSAAVRIGCNNHELYVYHVVFEYESSGVDSVVVDAIDADAPAYNVYGQRVDDSYKGIVIKGGKKFVQK